MKYVFTSIPGTGIELTKSNERWHIVARYRFKYLFNNFINDEFEARTICEELRNAIRNLEYKL